jgi:hypothetical protein
MVGKPRSLRRLAIYSISAAKIILLGPADEVAGAPRNGLYQFDRRVSEVKRHVTLMPGDVRSWIIC